MNLDPAINTESSWLCAMLQAGDSFYPTGSYAHSFGLEGLVQSGIVRDQATLREFIFRSLLPALRQTELPLAIHAWRALTENKWEDVGDVCELSAALKTSVEARQAADNIGRQRAELLAALRPSLRVKTYLERAAAGRWSFSPAVSVALEGVTSGAPLAAILSAIVYAALSATISAAMKLLRLGQNASQALLTAALAEVPALLEAAGNVPFDEIGWFNPWLDIAAARHEIADSRMFIS
jgi:urease accessory protein